MNRKIVLITAALAFGVAGCMSTPMTSAPPMAVTSAAQFVPMATSSNTFEIESSRMALQRSRDPGVRRYAQRMIRDHSLTARRMMAVVRQAGMSAPPAMLVPRHQAMLDQLAAAQGPAFDAAYLGAQTMAHQESVALFSSYASNGDNPPLVRFASATLPSLEMHLQMAQETRGGAPSM